MTDFFSRQVREIRESKTLGFYGLVLSLTHVLTFLYWEKSSFFISSHSSLNPDPLCYPFFPSCDLLGSFIPAFFWQGILFFYLFLGLYSIWCFFNRDRIKRAYFSLLFGTLVKILLSLSSYQLTNDFSYMVTIVILIYLFIPNKKINISYLVVVFYLVSGLSRMNPQWLGLSESVSPGWLSRHFPLLLPVFVILLESCFVFFLLSGRRFLVWGVLFQLFVFHLLSACGFGFYEPLLMLCLVSLFFIDDFFKKRNGETKVGSLLKFMKTRGVNHLKLFLTGKEKVSVYICLSVFAVIQMVPVLLPVETRPSLLRLISLNLSGKLTGKNFGKSSLKCRAMVAVHREGQVVHLTGPVYDFLKPRFSCDPLVFLNYTHQLCRKNKKSREFDRLSLNFAVKKTENSRYRKILDIPNVCEFKNPLLFAVFYDGQIREKNKPRPGFAQFKKLDSTCQSTAQYRHDENRTGVALEGQPRAEPEILRKIPLNVGIHTASKASPTVDDSGVYVGSDTGWFWKMDHAGEILWSFYVPGSGNGIHGSAGMDDKKVYIGAYNGFMYGLDKKTGDLVWAEPVGDYIGSSPLVAGGNLYISSETRDDNGFVAKLDCNTGEILWSSPRMGGHSHSSPVYDGENRLIMAGANSGRFYAFDQETGRTLWKVQTHGQIKGTAMIHGSRVFFGTWGKNYQSYDTKTGKKNWHSFMVGRVQTSLTLVPGENLGITNMPIGEIVGINLDDGTIAWRLRHGDGNHMFSVLVTKNPEKKGDYLAWSRCKEFQLCTLSAKTGKLIRNMELPGSFTSVPFAYKNRIYISLDFDGGLLILE